MKVEPILNQLREFVELPQSPGAVAKRWDVSRQTIYNLMSRGKLHSFRVGAKRLIPWSEIERIERGETQ